MLTPFGQALRGIRIENQEHSDEMADKLEIDIVELSFLEHQTSNIDQRIVERITRLYNLPSGKSASLRSALEKTLASPVVEISSADAITQIGYQVPLSIRQPTMDYLERLHSAK